MLKKLIAKFKKPKPLPPSCGYQGYEFGGGYLDSQCFGGKLYDMDNCDNDGMIYDPGDDIPCPACQREDAIMYWATRVTDMPSLQDFTRAISLVDDIRKNRGLDIP